MDGGWIPCLSCDGGRKSAGNRWTIVWGNWAELAEPWQLWMDCIGWPASAAGSPATTAAETALPEIVEAFGPTRSAERDYLLIFLKC